MENREKPTVEGRRELETLVAEGFTQFPTIRLRSEAGRFHPSGRSCPLVSRSSVENTGIRGEGLACRPIPWPRGQRRSGRLALVAVEEPVKLAADIPLHGWDHVRVDVQGHFYTSVPRAFGYQLRVHTGRQEHRDMSVA